MQFLQHLCSQILLLGSLKMSIYFLQFYCKGYVLICYEANWISHFMLAAVLKLCDVSPPSPRNMPLGELIFLKEYGEGNLKLAD